MKLEVITHCYNPPGISTYAACLEIQANSLMTCAANSPHDVTLSVCVLRADDGIDNATSDVMDRLHDRDWPRNFQMNEVPLVGGELFRRAIGRNLLAKATDADVVWFADVDYFPRGDFLTSVNLRVKRFSGLVYPRTYWIHQTHELGDAMLQRQPMFFHQDDFKETRPRKPIGGLMFVGGVRARQGYLDNTKWTKPVDPERGFRQCRCDVRYRKSLPEPSTQVAIETIYRIRHTQNGRDYDYKGELIGKRGWK